MANDDRVRVEIGFASGALMIAAVPAAQADQLEQQLRARADEVIELLAEDGTYLVALPHVTYVKRFSRESRVGFGHA
jgi:hypothetical protein